MMFVCISECSEEGDGRIVTNIIMSTVVLAVCVLTAATMFICRTLTNRYKQHIPAAFKYIVLV